MNLEARLIEAAKTGVPLDLIGTASQPDRAEMESWGADRAIEAGVIRKMLLSRATQNGDPRGIQLRGARISGPLDLANIRSDIPIAFLDCLLDGGINLRRARLISVALARCAVLTRPVGACVQGQQFVGALHLKESTFDGDGGGIAIDLRDAQVTSSLDLSGAQLSCHDGNGDSLVGDGLVVDGGMFLLSTPTSIFTAAGALRLPEARIRGQLELSGAQLTGHDTARVSLVADGLAVGGNMFLRPSAHVPFTAAGALRLAGAHIGGQLSLAGAQLTGYDADGDSLIGHGLVVDQDVFLRASGNQAFTTAGALGLQGAKIQGQLNLSGAQLTGCNRAGNSLVGDGLSVANGMFFGHIKTAAGAIRLPGAHIGGQLDLSDAQLTGQDESQASLLGQGLIVDGDVFLGTGGRSVVTVAGMVQLARARISGQLRVFLKPVSGDVTFSLAGASIGELWLVPVRTVPTGIRVDLRDTTYTRLPWLDDVDQWLELLRNRSVTYTPQAYQQLASVHRAAGHEHDARKILIAQQDERRRQVLRTPNDAGSWTRVTFWARRTGLWLQKVTIGYGYRTWPAFVGVLVLAAVGAGLGVAAGHTHAGSTNQYAAYRPTSTIRTTSENCSVVEQAALGVRVPFLSNLGAGDCALNTTSLTGGVYSVVIWTDQALAWAAATLAVAGYTGLVRKT